jgi:hypothetical protein
VKRVIILNRELVEDESGRSVPDDHAWLGYSEAVAYLKANPQEILQAWRFPDIHKAGRLFQYLGPDPSYGCATQVAHGFKHSFKDIPINRERMPINGNGIRAEHLDYFKEIQELYDAR